MSQAIAIRTIGGKAAMYARIKRLSDNYWFDDVAHTWIATATADCNNVLTESAGNYTVTSGMTATPGELYAIYVYESTGDLWLIAIQSFSTIQSKTALQIVNTVQRDLGLSETASGDFLTDSHAKKVLRFANNVQSDMIAEAYAWDELKLKGSICTRDGVGIYYIFPVAAAKIDLLDDDSLQISGYDPLEKLTDEDFRAAKLSYTDEDQPLYYRIYGRAGNALIIEVLPIPDAAYQIDFDALQKPNDMAAVGDYPVMDSDTIIAGTLLKAQHDNGEDVSLELAAFQSKLGLISGAQSASDWSECKPV